jgi:hypothetical protein
VHAQNRAEGAEISASVGQRSCGTRIDEVGANDERRRSLSESCGLLHIVVMPDFAHA